MVCKATHIFSLREWVIATGALMLTCAQPARAADEEIQVYLDELNAPREIGLDVHVNAVASGQAGVEYPGQEPSLHRWRVTPEFSLGMSRTVELGLYLPLATIAPDGQLRVEGAKARVKWIAPHNAEGFFGGANLEIGRVGYRLDQNPWNGEFKLIGGWRHGPWLIGMNGNLDFALSGQHKTSPTLEIASKFGYRVGHDVTLGLETYNGLGSIRTLGEVASSTHSTYAVIDTHLGKWGVNFGLGRGYGQNRDTTIFKLIVGVPIGK